MASSSKPATKPEGPAPWWVRDPQSGASFATYYPAEGLEYFPDESPFDRNGNPRAAEPGGADSAAPADTEGNKK